MGFGALNDMLVFGITLAGLLGSWWKWGRHWLERKLAPLRQRNEQRDAMYAGWQGFVTEFSETKASVGRMTGEVRTINSTLDAQNRVLGTLQARSQSAYESSTHAEFECDSEGRNESVNSKYAELLGVEKHELLGYRWRSFISAAELDSYLLRFQAAAADHRRFDDEINLRHTSGRMIRVRVHMIPFPPDVGPATHWTGILTPL